MTVTLKSLPSRLVSDDACASWDQNVTAIVSAATTFKDITASPRTSVRRSLSLLLLRSFLRRWLLGRFLFRLDHGQSFRCDPELVRVESLRLCRDAPNLVRIKRIDK